MSESTDTGKRVMLAVDGLVVKYGGIEALHGISLRVDAGEIVGVLGPNGAGKSSALNGIIGLVRPARGRVEFEGSDITGHDTESIVRGGLALVPERRRLFGRLSVRDNLALGAASRRDKEVAAAGSRTGDGPVPGASGAARAAGRPALRRRGAAARHREGCDVGAAAASARRAVARPRAPAGGQGLWSGAGAAR